jgi:uncharacterized protein (DUF1778 family)
MSALSDTLPQAHPALARTPISLRVPAGTLATIDRAAASQGRDRTEFMVAAALAAAYEQLERERVLRLDGTAFDELKRALDAPTGAPAALARLMGRRPVWEAAAES